MNYIYGWGIRDVTYSTYTRVTNSSGNRVILMCPYYVRWRNLLKRSLCPKFKMKNPTYKDCTVCEEWRYFSNFIKWVDEQPNKDWQKCSLDKDLLVKGNKHYSPETCVFVDSTLNSFLTDRLSARGNYMLGACWSEKMGKFFSQCRNPFSSYIGQGQYLGLFDTELEAHLAWKAKKHEYACQLADLQDDPRVAEALINRYK